MASTFANNARRGAASNRIDLPLAAIAGLAVAFTMFVMPGDLLGRAVEATGLPQFLSAAQPPLGTKARALAAAAGAIAAFGAVFLLLRILGRRGRPAPRRREEPEAETAEPAAPRLRRADVHPDAPSRRPILAARELGEPVRREPATAAPFWRPDDFPAEPDEPEAAEPQAEVVEEPEALDLGGPEIEILQPEAFVRSDEPAPPAEEFAPPPSVDESTLPDLMQRLERGLARRLRQQGVFPVAEVPTIVEADPQPEPVRQVAREFAPEGDDRLRSAIENLQKMAARAR